jgi:hypothetical protein
MSQSTSKGNIIPKIAHDGGFDGPQIVTYIDSQPIADINTVADSASISDNQAGCGLLLVCGVGDSSGYLVEGFTCVQNRQPIPD